MLNTRNEQIIAQKGENGYHSFRIPGILPAENGALLLCCEARAENAGDWGDIDVVVWRMEADGSYVRIQSEEAPLSSQEFFFRKAYEQNRIPQEGEKNL